MAWATRFIESLSIVVEKKPINCVRFYKHPERVVVYVRGGGLYLVSMLRNQVRRHYQGVECRLNRLRFAISPDDDQSFIVAGSEDGKAYIWDAVTSHLVETIDTGFRTPLCDVDWHPSAHLLAVCSYGSDSPVILMDNVKTSTSHLAADAAEADENHEMAATATAFAGTAEFDSSSRGAGDGVLVRGQRSVMQSI
uniref:Uncharacterized protein n=1 Tax=Lotharella oceanica TaxID=641309 RepID=A0A7S2X7U6_9EUKA